MTHINDPKLDIEQPGDTAQTQADPRRDRRRRHIAGLLALGVVVGIGGMPDAAFARAYLPAFARPVIWLATARRRRAAARAHARFVYLFMRPDGAQLAELARWIDDGSLRAVLHRTYPLAEVREAFAELERGRARGKIVVTI